MLSLIIDSFYILQALALKESRILLEDLNDDTAIPDILGCVQEILSTIFVSMYNHHDAEERCFSDCLAELPEYDTVEDKKVLSAYSNGYLCSWGVSVKSKHISTEM